MNVKLWAGVIVAMLVLTGTGLYMSSNTTDDDSLMIVSRVNTNGSGIFGETDITLGVASTWGGKTFATPGVSSIQHMILQDYVENELGLNFAIAPGSDLGTVYWTAPGAGGVSIMKQMYENGDINGGIVWEPVFSTIILGSSKSVHTIATTEQLQPGHACCVIAVSREYAQSHGDDIIRFLAAYSDILTWMEGALGDTTSEDYDKLVQWAIEFTEQGKDVVEASFGNVTFISDLTGMKGDVIDLVETYTRIGLLQNTVQDLGFNNTSLFADWLVNESYLNTANTLTPADYADSPQITINVARLQNDIHQLALYVGGDRQLGTFSEYKISINFAVFGVGGDVATAIIAGGSDIGFLGAPPVVLTTINMGR